ncbi:MAG: PIN domain-containing protein [Desulfobulbaceae bacterium]|nr:PIN domain-containing protein [Desulfobulbaceae bacterium]
MIAVDTNVLVRLLTHDDEKQFQKAASLFAENDIFIAATAILETEWVLRYAYKFAPEAILDAFTKPSACPMYKSRILDPSPRPST